MILPWKNYLEKNEVSFVRQDGIKYLAYPNSTNDIKVRKINLDGTEKDLTASKWTKEKAEISNQYSDIYGVFEPVDKEDLEPDDYKQCMFGKTPEGLYLDQLQRPEYVMNHDMTTSIEDIVGWGKIHTPDGGKTILKTEWHPTRNEFYNCIRCDVFPENPGWKQISKEEAINKIMETVGSTNPSRAKEICDEIDNETFPLPNHKDSNIIGNWLIP